MKKISILLLLVLASCAQLQKGQMQPVIARDLKQNIWMTNCGGAVETWASCHEKARNTCQKGYAVSNQTENSTGTSRELIFQCKK